MQTAVVSSRDIANHPNLSLAPKDYIGKLNLYRITRLDGWLNGKPQNETPHAERCGHYIRATTEAEAIKAFHNRFPGAPVEVSVEKYNVGELKFPGGK